MYLHAINYLAFLLIIISLMLIIDIIINFKKPTDLKLILIPILVFTIAIFSVSFKLPEIQVIKLYSTPSGKVIVDDAKINKSIINAIKINEYQKVETTNLGVGAYPLLSKLQLVLINIFTLVLIFMVFLVKVKYFD